MYRTPVRIAVLVTGLLLTAGLGYRVFQDERTLNVSRRDAAAADASAAQVEESLIDLRASLHAYVAPGQGLPFWAKRAQGTIDTLRDSLKALDATVSPSGGSLAESLDSIDQLTAAERRARTHVSRGENELAADVIFTEIRDLLAAASSQVDGVRAKLKADADKRIAAAHDEQVMLASGILALWLLIAVGLTPVPDRSAGKDPAEWRNELKETLAKPIPVTPMILDAPTPVAPNPLDAPVAAVAPTIPLDVVRRVSEVCADLSALADPAALDGALRRVTEVLDATGLIVWVASNDAASLSPVATYGFDAKLVSRIGKVPRDSANLTAAAFRDNVPKMSMATETAPAALAVALCGPTGPAGVLSIELKTGQSVDDAKVTLAAIVAAQLATLAMPVQDVQDEPVEFVQQRAAI